MRTSQRARVVEPSNRPHPNLADQRKTHDARIDLHHPDQKTSHVSGLSLAWINSPERSISALEKALLTREEWLRLAVQESQLGLWCWNEVTQTLFWDLKTREMFGVNGDREVTLETFYKALHPDDLGRVREVWRHQLENGLAYDIEYRALRPDGSIRWINARGSSFHREAGQPHYMIGVVMDVTDRRGAEQERLELSGRLIKAQEQERKRLAQEIHDDFGQRLSLLMVELEALAEMTKNTKAGVLAEESVRIVDDLTHDLHCLSHRLHSSKLEILGLVPSIRSLCADLSKQQAIQINFDHVDVPTEIPTDTALALFRIVQEGLHNVSKHSRASRVRVRITRTPEAISLTLSDNGRGFDVSRNYVSKGIGIQSMRERARLLGAIFEVQSRPSIEGTQITVIVPLKRALIAA
ncbi:MAG TPA: PAS domain-containing protein [Candidatus Binatia bacterium]|nr:PAS domain-containing protein [Candidatus Binatia bacterium]